MDQRNDQPGPTGFQRQQPQKQNEAYNAHTHPGKERAELLSNDSMVEALEASCGRATRENWGTVGDPGARSSEAHE